MSEVGRVDRVAASAQQFLQAEQESVEFRPRPVSIYDRKDRCVDKSHERGHLHDKPIDQRQSLPRRLAFRARQQCNVGCNKAKLMNDGTRIAAVEQHQVKQRLLLIHLQVSRNLQRRGFE